MSSLPLPPPEYGATQAKAASNSEATEPLLQRAPSPRSKKPAHPVASPWAYDDDGEEGGVPADFAGMTVSQSSIEIRNAFIRKVYSILFLQIAATAGVGAFARTYTARVFILQHTWVLIVPLLSAFVCMLFLHHKRHSSPANLILLSLFTVLEAMGVGGAVAFVETGIILQALIITGFIFIGLTLFTFQTKRDFTGMGPYLGVGLMTLILTSFVGIFLPFSRTIDAIYAGVGTLVFSGYIVYDTQQICKNLSPDEFILATISLYLDAINLFLMIVRLLTDSREN